ncbi:MAG: hypothetical protein A2868_00300 [Candidatus Levybacteria bacterium RIFCSPHIGHO2_01_FULL_40_15b]|nr:MAG: hypothetical protein A2868_00300 [Candidatus Levybacteria bacterium RIFCSPHIGHO2_01_FULL_40_15b]
MDIFKNKIYLHLLYFILSLVLQFTIIFQVIGRTVNNWSVMFWILSLIFLYLSFPFTKKGESYPKSETKLIPLLLVIILAVSIRVALMTKTSSFHIDEYLTTYFSYSLGDITKIDWFGVYPPKGVWVSQFPVFYFLYQKIFFNLAGLSTITMRLSMIPYIVIIFVTLYLVTKHIYNQKSAIIAILIFAFFSPDLYLSRWSLHFISSTAALLTTLYFFILSIKTGEKIHFALFGFFLGTCYLTYYSSYIALPVFLIYIITLFITKGLSIKSLINFFLALGIFLYTISPFITYAMKVDNFFTQRAEQIALINGEWSPYQNVIITPNAVFEILKKQTILSVESLYKDGVGGHAGYWFGKLALFDSITFVFFILSLCYLIFKFIKDRTARNIFFVSIIFFAFITGMIFTIPPPAFHRFSIAFPFIAIVIAASINDFYLFLKSKKLRGAFLIIPLFSFAIILSNIIHFKNILKTDGPDDPEFPKIQRSLVENNAHFVYIAAFDSYSLGKVLFIRSDKTINSLTHRLEEILGYMPHKQISYLVVLYPNEESIKITKTVFPKSEIVNRYDRHLVIKVVD